MAGSSRASAPRSRRSAPRGSGTATRPNRPSAPRKRKFFDYPRTGYSGLHRWLPSWRFLLGSVLSVGFLGLGVLVAAYVSIDIPAAGADVQAQTTTVYYAGGTKVMGTFEVQKRQLVDLETLPAYVGHAVISAEDRTFETNRGVSITGMARAFVNNVRGGKKQGGSTLTQQYVERYYVDKTTTDYLGKLRETLLAVKITQTESKDEILERYLNTIYFGRDSYGIQAAARAYFGKDAKDLTISEAAMIAGIIPSPNNWDPAVSPDKAEARWKIVMNAMLEDGHITQAEFDAAQFPETKDYSRSAKYQGTNGYLLKMVEDEMASDAIKIDKEALDRGGYKVVTTIQQPVQAQLTSTMAKLIAGEITDGEAPSPNLKVAGVSIDPASGGIISLYGGPDFLTDQVNWATYGNGIQAGSTFKPFTLVAALREGISLDTRFSGRSPMKIDGWGDDDKTVTNFGLASYGNMNLVDATAESVNTVYAQLNMQVGPENTAKVAKDAGIVSTPVENFPSNVLGTSPVHPLDLANAYATFAAQGVRHDAHIVDRVLNPDGSVNYHADTSGTRVFDQDVMADATYAMTQVVERGSGKPYIKPLGVPIAGKTGTSNDNRSAWFVGYTPTIATAIAMSQVGDDGITQVTITPVGREPSGRALGQVTGGSIPARTWADYMGPVLQLEQFAKVQGFPERADVGDLPTSAPTTSPTPAASDEPTTEPTQDAQVKVPGRLTNKTQADATSALVGAGLVPVIVTQASDEVTVGRVISVEPGSGTKVAVGTSVTLVVSTGPEHTPDPTPDPSTEPDPEGSATPGTQGEGSGGKAGSDASAKSGTKSDATSGR